jgi:hypothetical protein
LDRADTNLHLFCVWTVHTTIAIWHLICIPLKLYIILSLLLLSAKMSGYETFEEDMALIGQSPFIMKALEEYIVLGTKSQKPKSLLKLCFKSIVVNFNIYNLQQENYLARCICKFFLKSLWIISTVLCIKFFLLHKCLIFADQKFPKLAFYSF